MPQVWRGTLARKWKREGLAGRSVVRYPPCIAQVNRLTDCQDGGQDGAEDGSARSMFGKKPYGRYARPVSLATSETGGTLLLSLIFW